MSIPQNRARARSAPGQRAQAVAQALVAVNLALAQLAARLDQLEAYVELHDDEGRSARAE